MKTLKTITVSILLLTVLATSCQNEVVTQNCVGDNVQLLQTFYSEEFATVPCSLQNIESTDKEVNLVISNQTDFEKYFTCTQLLPEIDFEKYFILAGRYKHNNCAVFDSQQVLICQNKIIYKVKLLEQDCKAITSVYYATVIEIKYNSIPVEFDIQFKN